MFVRIQIEFLMFFAFVIESKYCYHFRKLKAKYFHHILLTSGIHSFDDDWLDINVIMCAILE